MTKETKTTLQTEGQKFHAYEKIEAAASI